MGVKKFTEKKLWQWKMMEYLSYSIVFLTPLFFKGNSTLFLFSTPKMIMIIGIILLTTIFYAWGNIAENKISFKFTPLHLVSLIFLFVLTASSIFGLDPLNSFFGRWNDGINLILIYSLTVFSFLIGFLVKKDKKFLSKILLASFMSSILVALISYTGGSWLEIFKNGSSTIGNSSYTGAYLLFNICFGIGLFFYYSKIWQKISVGLGILIVVLCPVLFNQGILLGKIGLTQILNNPFLVFGYANAATVGLSVSILAIVAFLLIFSSKKVSKIIGFILLLGVLLGSLYTGFQLVNSNSSLHQIYLETKGENRFVAWDVAKISFINHPFLGSGFNNFSYSYQKYFTADILKEKFTEFYFSQPHNVIWEYASNNGILGLVSFFALLIFAFLSLFKTKENEDKKEQYIRIALIGAIFGYFIQNLFGFDTPMTYLALFLVIGLAIGESKKEWIWAITDKQKDGFNFILSLIIIVSLVSVVLFVILPCRELSAWDKAMQTDNTKERIFLRNKMQGISLFGGVYDSANIEGKSYDLYMQNINNINDSNRSLYIDEIQSAVDQLEKDIKKQPDEIRSYITLSHLLNLEIFVKGDDYEDLWNQSYNNVRKAIALNPKNPETYILLAQPYVTKNDFEKAFLALRQAISIYPKYEKSYSYARKILKISPNKDFQKYIDSMSTLK